MSFQTFKLKVTSVMTIMTSQENQLWQWISLTVLNYCLQPWIISSEDIPSHRCVYLTLHYKFSIVWLMENTNIKGINRFFIYNQHDLGTPLCHGTELSQVLWALFCISLRLVQIELVHLRCHYLPRSIVVHHVNVAE